MSSTDFAIAAEAFIHELQQYWILLRILMIAGSVVIGGLVGGLLAIRRGLSAYM
jgi:hypothetical protein